MISVCFVSLWSLKINFALDDFKWCMQLHYVDKSTGPPTHYTGSSCSTMETVETQFDVDARESLEPCSFRVGR